VVIAVRDSGIGIPAESLPHVFDMFAQLNRGFERESGGLGIGLALVKGLVEMHGGTISASSDGEGKGSTFTVRLPRASAPSRGPFEPSPDLELSMLGPKRRILVVDDNQDAADSMARVFRLRGSDVRKAYDGNEAVQQAEAFRPEIILMDMGMPSLDGYEATRRIRNQPWGRDVIIVALTGWGQEVDRRRSKEAGCDGHLVKPVDLADLETLLRILAAKRDGQAGQRV
jgi:CheY-like chemotaxis protein